MNGQSSVVDSEDTERAAQRLGIRERGPNVLRRSVDLDKKPIFAGDGRNGTALDARQVDSSR